MRIAAVAFGVAAMAVATAAAAQSPEDLLKKNGCTACHAIDKKIVGPAYMDVSEKYRNDKGAAAKLFEKVKKGGSGVWGQVPMPPNPQVSDADLKQMLAFILDLHNKKAAPAKK
ncbi:MAG TPA: c-type cytochrome [Casimicrobiaceae bacterium]|nr:c-type cytochrome [Casimicrobiaceae bacterium]